MHRLLFLIAGLLLALTPLAARAQTPDVAARERLEAELVPLSQAVAPGSTAVVAVRQVIAPGWHTYWRNPGDSGGPTTLEWTLPPGFRADPILWPTPTRQRLMSLVNYGYEGEVLLPVPIEVPASAQPGTNATLRARAVFLVCSDEICIPDERILSLTLPVREGAAAPDPRWGDKVQAALTAAPRPAGIEARAQLVDGKAVLTLVGGPLAEGRIERAWFYPFTQGEIDHAAPQAIERGPRGLTVTLAPGRAMTRRGDAGALAGIIATDRGDWEVAAATGEPLTGATGGGAVSTDEAPAPEPFGLMGLLKAAGLALAGGLLLNLMPCVFPILAMKAASLAATAHEPRAARRDGLLFTAGVLVSFLALAGTLLVLRAGGQALGWGFQLQTPGVTALLALVMLGAGLNLSGVYHIGRGLQGAGSGPLARLPGAAGAFFTGVLAVVVAAPCTAPFMAAALGAALVMLWPAALAVFFALGLGLALPYLAVSLSPAARRLFPRPGLWMERLKGLLAFPLYGAALWLAWVFAGQAPHLAVAALFATALTATLGLWLFGRTQAEIAHGRRGALHAVATAFVLLGATALAVLLTSTPVEERPEGAGAAQVRETGDRRIIAHPWSEAAQAQAVAAGRPVLVNFTADWCVTCKINEAAALSSPRVATALDETDAVYLIGDWTRRDEAIARELQRHGRAGVPLYLVYAPGETQPRVLPQLLTEGLVVEALKSARAAAADTVAAPPTK